jgi:hypothetical protein
MNVEARLPGERSHLDDLTYPALAPMAPAAASLACSNLLWRTSQRGTARIGFRR